MSYEAIVVKLENVRPHGNADRLKLATALGYTVVVGLDAREGDLMLLFPDDGQLSQEYCDANGLIGVTDPVTGVRTGGYFNHQRRVCAQTFRGAKSEAYVAGLDSVAFADPDKSTLILGNRFSEINGVPICNKYVTPATLKAARLAKPQQQKKEHELERMFAQHFDTAQLRHVPDDELTGLVTITQKLHGTSARSGLVKGTVTAPWTVFGMFRQTFLDAFCGEAKSLLNFFLTSEQKERLRTRPTVPAWRSVYGTRRVIKGEATDNHKDFRAKCHRILESHILKGEIWYYEIVGYEETGALIMQSADCSKMGKQFVKRYGNTMTYKYGCLPEKCEIYVYRIVTENEDGEVYELPWAVVKDRCRKAGIKHVPELYQSIVTEKEVGQLRVIVEQLTEGSGMADPSELAEPLDPSHIREGVCARVDRLDNGKMRAVKNKTFAFKVLEGIVKDSGVVDIEEVEAEAA